MAVDKSLVSVGKPAIGGAIYVAPLGTTLPTSATEDLDEAFVCLGYVSKEGLKNSTSSESEEIKAWGGDPVVDTDPEFTDEFSYKLIEATNVAVLKHVHGPNNVTGTLQTGVHVSVDGSALPEQSLVVDMVLNNALKRIVVPRSKVSEVGEISYVDDDVIGYDVKCKARKDAYGKYHHEYISAVSGSLLGSLTVSSSVGASSGKTAISVTGTKGTGNIYKYYVDTAAASITYAQNVSAWETWDGSSDITAATGKILTLVEASSAGLALKAGSVTVTAHS